MRRGRLRRRARKPVYPELEVRFWREQVSKGGCVMPVPHEGPVECHHILPKRLLKREGHGGRLYDVRNGIPLCRVHHARHESAFQRVPFELLPTTAFEFADELGLRWALERYYPADEVGRCG